MYTPGSPPSALKHSDVSSTSTGPPTCCAARRHLARDTSSGSPCSSGRSSLAERSGNGHLSPKMAVTSSSFFRLPVTNVSSVAMAAKLRRWGRSGGGVRWRRGAKRIQKCRTPPPPAAVPPPPAAELGGTTAESKDSESESVTRFEIDVDSDFKLPLVGVRG